MPVGTPMYIAFVGEMLAGGLLAVVSPVRLRNIKAGHFAIGNRLHIGEVVRCNVDTCIHNLEGRQPNTLGSAMEVPDDHRVGWIYYAPCCMYNASLPRSARIAYIDARTVRWCSVGSVAFHSFCLP